MSIKNRISKLKKDSNANIEENIVCLMKYFGWTLDDIKKLTLPSYLELIRLIKQIEPKPKKK